MACASRRFGRWIRGRGDPVPPAIQYSNSFQIRSCWFMPRMQSVCKQTQVPESVGRFQARRNGSVRHPTDIASVQDPC
jgi:hypothetical protein